MPVDSRIRMGVLALPLGTLLGLISVLIRGSFINPAVNPTQFAQAAIVAYQVGSLIAIPSVIVQGFSFIALYGFLVRSKANRAAFWGMIFSSIGGSLTLSLIGVFAFVFPSIGKFYLDGQANVIQVAISANGAPFLPIALLSGVFSTIGAILFGVAFWKSERFPRWVVALYVLSVPLFYFAPPAPFFSEVIGFALFFIANCFVVRAIISYRAAGASEA